MPDPSRTRPSICSLHLPVFWVPQPVVAALSLSSPRLKQRSQLDRPARWVDGARKRTVCCDWFWRSIRLHQLGVIELDIIRLGTVDRQLFGRIYNHSTRGGRVRGVEGLLVVHLQVSELGCRRSMYRRMHDLSCAAIRGASGGEKCTEVVDRSGPERQPRFGRPESTCKSTESGK